MKTSAFALCLTAMSLGGCAHDQSKKVSRDTAAASLGTGGTKNTPDGVASSCVTDAGCATGQRCVNNTCVAGGDELAACTDVRVHFAFDSVEIPEEARPQLQRAAGCLRSSQSTKVAIEGNTDERGTDEYNVALGDRRAQSVASYLEKLGASASQLKTISYGKENPLCAEHDEDCWAKNRRAAVKPDNK